MRILQFSRLFLSGLIASPVALAQWNGRPTQPPWVPPQFSKTSSSSSVSATSHTVAVSSQAGASTTNAGAALVGGTLVATKISSSSQAVVSGGTNNAGTLASASGSASSARVGSSSQGVATGGSNNYNTGSLGVASGSAISTKVGSSLVATSAGNGAVATGTSAATSANPSGGSQICFKFSGSSFYYQNAYSWGTGSGPGGGTTQCFSSTAVGGAMFLASSPISGFGDTQGLTKLECTFGGQYQNCDISLVDGFSVPLQCQIPGGSPPTIGGLTNLWTLGAPCESVNADGACNNAQGYAPTQSSVTQFFVNANWTNPQGQMPAGGNYCVWQNCSGPSDSFFTGTPTIPCQVGTGGKAKRSVDLSQEWKPRAVEEKRGPREGTTLSDANQDMLDARRLENGRSHAAVARAGAVGVRMRARRLTEASLIST